MSRRKGRELAMQMLFQWDQGGARPGEVEELFWRCNKATEASRKFAQSVFQQAVISRERIDELVRGAVAGWTLERLASVDRSLIRMAVAEFLTGATPKAVVIDEAVEIAKEYGGDRSPEFINGILDTILGRLERSET